MSAGWHVDPIQHAALPDPDRAIVCSVEQARTGADNGALARTAALEIESRSVRLMRGEEEQQSALVPKLLRLHPCDQSADGFGVLRRRRRLARGGPFFDLIGNFGGANVAAKKGEKRKQGETF